MRRRFAIVVLAAAAVAGAFILPAQASGKSTHVIVRASVRALHAPSARAVEPQNVNVAWVVGATMPVAVEETGGGAAAGGIFYVIGGFTSFSPVTVVNNNQVYSKATNTWLTKAPIPGTGGGWGDAAFCYNSADKTIHVVNGTDGAFLYASHQVYSTMTDTWSNKALPNTAVDGNFYSQDSGCAFIGGKMYLFGGRGLTDLQGVAQVEKLTWVWDPVTDTWSDTGKLMVHPRLWMGYTSNTTTAFAAGGTDNDTSFVPIASTERFSPSTGWAATANLPKALLAPGEGLVGTHLVVWGGGDSAFAPQNKNYHCKLPACSSFTTLGFNLPSSKWFSAFGAGTSMFNAGGDTGGGTPVNSSEHLP